MEQHPKHGKVKATSIYEESGDEYDIDPVLKKELKEQGLAYKYIDFKSAKNNGGRSRSGWIIYKRQSEDPRLQGIKALADPDGLVRQGSMVLAVKTEQNADRQRSRRDTMNKSLRQYNKVAAEELEQSARKLGGSTRVLAGYDKNS